MKKNKFLPIAIILLGLINTGWQNKNTLENNKNIIWKSTGTSDNINKSTIPVIGNNNLKPEILGSSKVDDLAFPDMNKKEGEILWKETM